MPATVERERNPARSRAAILDAAERLFAEKGYDATSLSEVGAAAGSPGGRRATSSAPSRSSTTPCWSAAIRKYGRPSATGRARALASQQPAEAILAGAVSDYFDFLAARPNFIRLIERRALSGGGPVPVGEHLSAGQEALAAISAELGLDDAPSGDAAQLLLSIIALCWFHLIHAQHRSARRRRLARRCRRARAAQAPRDRARAARPPGPRAPGRHPHPCALP